MVARSDTSADQHCGFGSKDICYVLSFGFAARTVFHTELVPELKKRGLSVAAICPGADEPTMQALGRKLGIELFQAPKVGNRLLSEYLPVRRYLFEDVRNNPALWAKHLRETEPDAPLRDRVKLRCFHVLNGCLRRTGLQRYLTAEREQHLYQNTELRSLLRRISPRLLVATYPVDALEAIALAEAKRLGIKTVVQLLSWDNITSKGRFPVLAEHYLSWGSIMTQELREHYGLGPDRVTETGVAHFDAHVNKVDPAVRKRVLMEMGLDPDQPYVLFGMSSPYFAPHEIDIVEELGRRVHANEFGERLNLVVRPHPQNVRGYMADASWLPRLRALQGPSVGISWPKLLDSDLNWAVEENDLDILVNLMAGCLINLNSGSTFSIDGLCHGKPVILTLFDAGHSLPWHRSARRAAEYGHLSKLLATGGLFSVYSFDELHRTILLLLRSPSHNLQSRMAGLREECLPVDGRSCQRVAEALRALTGRRQNESLTEAAARQIMATAQAPMKLDRVDTSWTEQRKGGVPQRCHNP